MKHPLPPRSGFTLVELAVVLIIVALLLSGLMVPVSTQQDMKAVSSTEKGLTEIREALLGYALINQKLPCPMPVTVTDPNAANYGAAGQASDCNNEGILPWKTLGVSEVDAWGQKRSASTDSFDGYWRYRLHTNFKETINTASKAVPSEMAVYSHAGILLNVAGTDGEPPLAVVYSTGKNRAPDGRNGAATALDYEAGEGTPNFDDQLIWIARPVLFSRLAAAGKL